MSLFDKLNPIKKNVDQSIKLFNVVKEELTEQAKEKFEEIVDNVSPSGRSDPSAPEGAAQSRWLPQDKTKESDDTGFDPRIRDRKHLKDLDKHRLYLESFLCLENDDGLSLAFKEAIEAWSSYMCTKGRYDLAKTILIQDEKDYGLKYYVTKLDEYIESIEEYEDADLTLIKRLGYQNYIANIQKAFEKIAQAYKQAQAYDNQDYNTKSLFVLKGFINMECSQIACISDIPKALESIPEAKKQVLENNPTLYTFIRQVCQRLEQNREDAFSIGDLKKLAADYRNREKVLAAEVNKALKRAADLRGVFTEDWFEQFNPAVEDNALAAVTDKAALKAFYESQTKSIR